MPSVRVALRAAKPGRVLLAKYPTTKKIAVRRMRSNAHARAVHKKNRATGWSATRLKNSW
jgi:hypothetical protein